MILNKGTETARLSCEEFKKLPEYSTTLPTGTTPGKLWKREQSEMRGTEDYKRLGWYIGEYEDIPGDPNHIAINWYKITHIIIPPTAYVRSSDEEGKGATPFYPNYLKYWWVFGIAGLLKVSVLRICTMLDIFRGLGGL